LEQTTRQTATGRNRGYVRQTKAYRVWQASLAACLEKIGKNFLKIKKCCKLSEKRTKPKYFENYNKI
jgi:hypothetical protein